MRKGNEEQKKWIMPKWMEKYREHIGNTGGNPIEELMNDHHTNGANNVIRSALIISVDSQLTMLHMMKDAGLIEKKSQPQSLSSNKCVLCEGQSGFDPNFCPTCHADDVLNAKSEGRKEMMEEIENVVKSGMIIGLERVGYAIRAWVAQQKEIQWLSEQKKKEKVSE